MRDSEDREYSDGLDMERREDNYDIDSKVDVKIKKKKKKSTGPKENPVKANSPKETSGLAGRMNGM